MILARELRVLAHVPDADGSGDDAQKNQQADGDEDVGFHGGKGRALEFASGRIDGEAGLGIRVIRGEVQTSRFLALDGTVDD